MNSTDLAAPDKSTIRRIFNDIAFRYDFLNTLLSLRLDQHWRRRARKLVQDGREKAILDIGTGTGKFLKLFLSRGSFRTAVGIDFSQQMLKQARGFLPPSAGLVCADFHDMPFVPGTFDLIISSFTLRSVKDLNRFFLEVYEMLTPHGKAAFLCLTRPSGWFWKLVYYPYLNFYIPFIGRFFSGSQEAYTFLSRSIQSFQEPRTTMEMLRRNGFQTIEIRRFTFGAATLIIAKK